MPKAIVQNITPLHNRSLGDLVDELGAVNAQIAELEGRQRLLKTALIAAGIDKAEGAEFAATILPETMVSALDVKRIAADMGGSWCARFLRWSKRSATVRVAPVSQSASLPKAA
jgi:hypothetical protein